MDAHELKPEPTRSAPSVVVRLVIACLAVLLCAGLWQGYGEWLMSEVGRHVA